MNICEVMKDEVLLGKKKARLIVSLKVKRVFFMLEWRNSCSIHIGLYRSGFVKLLKLKIHSILMI